MPHQCGRNNNVIHRNQRSLGFKKKKKRLLFCPQVEFLEIWVCRLEIMSSLIIVFFYVPKSTKFGCISTFFFLSLSQKHQI